MNVTACTYGCKCCSNLEQNFTIFPSICAPLPPNPLKICMGRIGGFSTTAADEKWEAIVEKGNCQNCPFPVKLAEHSTCARARLEFSPEKSDLKGMNLSLPPPSLTDLKLPLEVHYTLFLLEMLIYCIPLQER